MKLNLQSVFKALCLCFTVHKNSNCFTESYILIILKSTIAFTTEAIMHTCLLCEFQLLFCYIKYTKVNTMWYVANNPDSATDCCIIAPRPCTSLNALNIV